jgi:hypothetical protein
MALNPPLHNKNKGSNRRVHSNRQIGQIADSIKAFGFGAPVLAIVAPAGDCSMATTRDCFEPGSALLPLESIVVCCEGFTAPPAAADEAGERRIAAIRKALENAGVKFISAGKSGGPGVRIRE